MPRPHRAVLRVDLSIREGMAAFISSSVHLRKAFADNDPTHPAVHELSNKPRVLYGKPGAYSIADLWHFRSRLHQASFHLNFLLAKTLPPVGGDTMFANIRSSQSLSPKMRELIRPLEALHCFHSWLLLRGVRPRFRPRSNALSAGRAPGSACPSGNRAPFLYLEVANS